MSEGDMSREDKEKLVEYLRQKAALEADKTIEYFTGSLIQNMCLRSKAKIRILVGANRSGKSHVGGVDTSIRATGVVPNSLADNFPTDKLRTGGYWVSALDFPSSRDVTEDKINLFLPQKFRKRWKEDDRIYTLTNGSTIGFKSSESGRKKYQGTSRLGIWFDEEHPEEVYDEGYMRTIDCGGYILFTFTPVEGLTWAHQKLYKRAKRYYFTTNKHNIPEDVGLVHTEEEIEKLKDRELRVRENTSPDADPDIEVFQMTIYDNPYVSNIEIQRNERKWKDDLAGYNARVLGRYSKLVGRKVFGVEQLLRMEAKAPTIYKRGDVKNGKFTLSMQGSLVIYKDIRPKGKGFYVIGADVAEGLEQGDFSVAQILDHRTCEQVAIWRGKVPPEQFADILVELGKFFNYAWIAPEVNVHGFGVVSRIRNHHNYSRLFCEYDVTADISKNSGGKQKKFGWHTNTKTKPIMIQDLAAFINDNHIRLNDVNTIDECLTFVYDENGRTGAMGGCYDDCVMALAIAIQIFKRRSPRLINTTMVVNPNIGKRIDPITGY